MRPFLLLLLLVMPSIAIAASPVPPGAGRPRITAAGEGTARFDWLAPSGTGARAPVRRPVKTRQVGPGKGSWICSAAGFAHRSHCYKR